MLAVSLPIASSRLVRVVHHDIEKKLAIQLQEDSASAASPSTNIREERIDMPTAQRTLTRELPEQANLYLLTINTDTLGYCGQQSTYMIPLSCIRQASHLQYAHTSCCTSSFLE
eukprot:2279752-Amphidinium_carterae.1